jgi:hypothetical protein
MASNKRAAPTFEVGFVAPGLVPEGIPLRAFTDALSAVQDLASGRDRFETSHVPLEKGIGLVDVRRGSAVYSCVSRAPDEARVYLSRVAALLSATGVQGTEEDGLVAALRPIESLSGVARSIGCRIEVTLVDHRQSPLFVVDEDAFRRISNRLLLQGDTTVIGRVLRVGGATSMRCFLRVPGRRHGLYCDVDGKDLVRRLGQHLYEQIVATGTATWIHSLWRIYRFKIRDFTQPQLGNPNEAIEQLRNAGLKAWDQIPDPDAFIQELRS